MAEDLKRVGLVFTAEGAIDFKNSLKEVNASISENIAAYKLAQSQYDKNTSASEKLADKQKFLAAQTDDYRKKVNIATAELREAENAEAKDQAAIDKKRAALETAQAQLNKYEKQLSDVNSELDSGAAKLRDYADNMQGISDKTGKVGSALTKNVTAPIAAIVTASIAAFNEVDGGMDIILAKTGATGDALKDMEDIAQDLATSIPVSFSEAGTAVGEVNTRFGVTGDQLKELSSAFLKFAKLNNVDVNSSIDNVQAAMAAFNVETDRAGEVLDILNKAGQNTGVSVDKLAQDLTTNSTALKEMGLNLNSSIGFLAELNKNGIDTSAVMAGLKKALQNATADGKGMDQALSELTASMANANTNTEAMALAVELFGAKAGPAIATAINEGKLSFDELSNTVLDFGDSVENTFEDMTDPTERWQQVMNQLMILGFQIAEAMMPSIQTAVETVTPIIQNLTDKWAALSPEQQDFIVKAAMTAAACGPVLSGVSGITGGISGLLNNGANLIKFIGNLKGTSLASFSSIKTGASSLFAFLQAHPAIAIITAVIAALVTLYNKCEWFRNGVNNILNGIKNTVTNIVSSIQSAWGRINFKLPSIKLPHFSIYGSFSLMPLSVPRISVSWYKNGGILNEPTIFGALGNQLLGGGEAGPEAVLPLDKLKDYIREVNSETDAALADKMKGVIVSAIVEALRMIGPGVYLDDEKIGEIFSDRVKEVLFNA